ncbi:hypothetical protein [Staphylococcus caledonicus]|uniref:hypothetical protein n=1 Tax=Staphylococcus caledonicus TaxID=2741333 RepID=UPI0018E48547|nr:hypothetical protein [Staphylococcus caledonicus]MBI5972091.1 hypothetical protein [Staphylococcus caledonicus]
MITKKLIVITTLTIIIAFSIYLFKQSAIEFQDKLTTCISFIGLFATFGGAYIGAKISGENSRKLYEKQKYEIAEETSNKVDLITNIKMIKVFAHSKRVQESKLLLYVDTMDNRPYEKIMDNGIMNVLELIDGYAKPIIELLEDREIYNGKPILYQSLLKMFNECNRMYYHVKQIDVTDDSGFVSEDYINLSSEERELIFENVHNYRDKVRQDILINFIEFEFIESILDNCANNILNSISRENRLIHYINFKGDDNMRYTINL